MKKIDAVNGVCNDAMAIDERVFTSQEKHEFFKNNPPFRLHASAAAAFTQCVLNMSIGIDGEWDIGTGFKPLKECIDKLSLEDRVDATEWLQIVLDYMPVKFRKRFSKDLNLTIMKVI